MRKPIKIDAPLSGPEAAIVVDLPYQTLRRYLAEVRLLSPRVDRRHWQIEAGDTLRLAAVAAVVDHGFTLRDAQAILRVVDRVIPRGSEQSWFALRRAVSGLKLAVARDGAKVAVSPARRGRRPAGTAAVDVGALAASLARRAAQIQAPC